MKFDNTVEGKISEVVENTEAPVIFDTKECRCQYFKLISSLPVGLSGKHQKIHYLFPS